MGEELKRFDKHIRAQGVLVSWIGVAPDAYISGVSQYGAMRILLGAAMIALGMACATRQPGGVKTQVITYPDGGIVEYNGAFLGRAPADVVLPQDAAGRLTQRAVVRALPNTDQAHLFAQSRVFDPSDRMDRVPNRILIDLRMRGTNEPMTEARAISVERKPKGIARKAIPYTERSKPTQAVGLDRWNPGIH